MSSNPKAVTMNIRERTRGWLSPLNLHWAGVGILSLICLYLLVNMAFTYQQAKSDNADAIARQQVDLQTAKIAEKPLEGLDAKLHTAGVAADRFYLERLPNSYSEFVAEIGVIATKEHVRLTRVQYSPTPVSGDAAGQLIQVQMDASLTGDYRSLVVFINSLERDRLFFVIGNVTLTGQQTGQVNLRLRIATYLRGPASPEELQKIQQGTQSADQTTASLQAPQLAGETR